MPDRDTTPKYSFLGLDAGPGARVRVLPVPYDGTASYGPGARFGPEAIVLASRYLELADEESGYDASQLGFATEPPVEPVAGDPKELVERVSARVGAILERGAFPLVLGGDHAVTVGALRAVASRFDDLALVQLDAHLDLRDRYEGSRYSHACTARRALDDLGLPVFHVGTRSASSEELALLTERGLRPLWARELAGCSRDARRERYLELVAELPERVYLTVDLDVFDPSVVPATGTPEPGGLDWYAVTDLARLLASRRTVVAADLVELAPLPEHRPSAYLAAKLAYRIAGWALGLRGQAAAT